MCILLPLCVCLLCPLASIVGFAALCSTLLSGDVLPFGLPCRVVRLLVGYSVLCGDARLGCYPSRWFSPYRVGTAPVGYALAC